ncbi:hypothetical protein LINPERPRIM_LOCUS33339, partial [Linum perenne]
MFLRCPSSPSHPSSFSTSSPVTAQAPSTIPINFPGEFEESDFEVGDWLSEEEVDEAKEVRHKVHEAKKKLKSGVPFLCNFNGDGYESDGLEEEDIGYYEETDPDDEQQIMMFGDKVHIHARTEIVFNRHKEQLCKENVAACEAMVKINPKHWSRAYFSTLVKCDSVDNNLSESFNALILEARHKPVFSMLEDIRTMCMEQIAVKMTLAKKWKSSFCPKILRKLAAHAKETRYCRIISNGKEGYEVRYKSEDHFTVQLDESKCSCRSWDLNGIPCPHAITCIISEGQDPQQFISECYAVQQYWSTYDHAVSPMDGHKSWVPSKYDPVLPPISRKMPGRPKKNRVKSVEEKEDMARKRKRIYTDVELLARDTNDPTKMSKVGRIMTCKSFRKEGNNTRTCSLNKQNAAKVGIQTQ